MIGLVGYYGYRRILQHRFPPAVVDDPVVYYDFDPSVVPEIDSLADAHHRRCSIVYFEDAVPRGEQPLF